MPDPTLANPQEEGKQELPEQIVTLVQDLIPKEEIVPLEEKPPEGEQPPAGEIPPEIGGVPGEELPPEKPPEAKPQEPKPEEPRKSVAHNRAQDRIGELTKFRRFAERDAGNLREIVTELTGKQAPDPKLFRNAEDYNAAFSDYKAKVTVTQTLLEKAERDIMNIDRQTQQILADSWQEKIREAAIPGFMEAVKDSTVPLSAQVTEAILSSPVGPHIIFHLANNPGEAYALADMTVMEQIRMVGRLEVKLEKTGVTPAPNKLGKTIPTKPVLPNSPPTPLGGAGVIPKKPVEKMTAAEYRVYREKGGT